MRFSVGQSGVGLILWVAVGFVMGEEPASRQPRLLSTSAKAKALQGTPTSTPPVARRRAGTFQLPTLAPV
ncbi:MAG TPA: hypothetical protein VIY86_05880, partial [Pirellulaceae bacterium]